MELLLPPLVAFGLLFGASWLYIFILTSIYNREEKKNQLEYYRRLHKDYPTIQSFADELKKLEDELQ